jgi:hypothetical protein
MTTATEIVAGSDEPTGRLVLGKMGPSDGLLGRSVRTSPFTTVRIGSYAHLNVVTTPEVAV